MLRRPFLRGMEALLSTEKNTKEILRHVIKTHCRLVVKFASMPSLCIFFLASKFFCEKFSAISNCFFNLIFKTGIPVFHTAASPCHGVLVCLSSKHKCSLLLEDLGFAIDNCLCAAVLNRHRQSFAEVFRYIVPVLWERGTW